MPDTDSEEREDPPELPLALPDCSVCGRTVDLAEDRFVCRACGAKWRIDTAFAEPGAWIDSSAPQCPSSSRFGERCLLAAGHLYAPGADGVHRRGWDDWKDPDR